MGYSLEAIQMIGRWGSAAVKRYIQEAPLAATPSHMVPSTSPPTSNLQELVRTELTRLSATPGGSSAKAALPIYQQYLRQLRTPDGELFVDGTTELHHIKRPGTDLPITFVANVFATWKMMTMAPPPRTSSPRTGPSYHRRITGQRRARCILSSFP